MPRTRPSYPAAFREQIAALARAGRSVPDLARAFEPTEQTIYTWLRQAERDDGKRADGKRADGKRADGKRADGLSSAEHEELRHLRKKNRRLRIEREILSKAAAWFVGEPRGRPTRYLRVRERAPGYIPCCHDVPRAGRLRQRVLRVAPASALRA